MLSPDLAVLYGVATKVLVQAVKRTRPFSAGLHVSVDEGGVRQLEVTICDFKLGWSSPRYSLWNREKIS